MKRQPRHEDLLVQRALQGLSDAELAELRALGDEGDERFELAVAALDLATLSEQRLPPEVAAKVLAAVPVRPASVVQLPPRPRAGSWVAWIAAAACMVLAVGAWRWAMTRPPVVVRVDVPTSSPVPTTPPVALATPADERAQLLATAKDATTIGWKKSKDSAAKEASGDVVWSDSAQKGFMRFVGLEPNDRTQAQYQLWIFDKARDARYPVDGGVFDVPAGGEVVVPINARLHIDQPALFAVTVEKPGGVVVSKRERIVVTAATTG